MASKAAIQNRQEGLSGILAGGGGGGRPLVRVAELLPEQKAVAREPDGAGPDGLAARQRGGASCAAGRCERRPSPACAADGGLDRSGARPVRPASRAEYRRRRQRGAALPRAGLGRRREPAPCHGLDRKPSRGAHRAADQAATLVAAAPEHRQAGLSAGPDHPHERAGPAPAGPRAGRRARVDFSHHGPKRQRDFPRARPEQPVRHRRVRLRAGGRPDRGGVPGRVPARRHDQPRDRRGEDLRPAAVQGRARPGQAVLSAGRNAARRRAGKLHARRARPRRRGDGPHRDSGCQAGLAPSA